MTPTDGAPSGRDPARKARAVRWAIMVGIALASLGLIMNVFWLYDFPMHALVSVILAVLALYGLIILFAILMNTIFKRMVDKNNLQRRHI